MIKKQILLCLCLIGLSTVVNAGVPQVINLSEAVVYNPQGGPDIEVGTNPTCDNCFTATITDDILNVVNDADEVVTVIVTDLTNNSIVISKQVSQEMEEQFVVGNYQIDIISESYAPLQGFFEVE
ncbi:MAG: hypothetical protein IJ650_00900 [Paludibacteraceae bacterium]|nr:hypothetical protein [Paludibacteraceae bacterium]